MFGYRRFPAFNIRFSDARPETRYYVSSKDIRRWAENIGDDLDGHFDFPRLPGDLYDALRHARFESRGDDFRDDEGSRSGSFYRWSFPKLGDYVDDPEPTITIYYKNHSFYNASGDEKLFCAEIYATFAHEFFHHIHHYSLGDYGLFDGDNSWKKLVVAESLADYFSYHSLNENYGGDSEYLYISNRLYDSWRQYFGSPWPYAYALLIAKQKDPSWRFKYAFSVSKESWEKAYDILMDGTKMDPFDTRMVVNSPAKKKSKSKAWEDLCADILTQRKEHGRAFFHVCQGNEWENESKGGYIFAPNDGVPSHEMVSLVRKGDMIIHHCGHRIRDISFAIADSRIGLNPVNGENGWLVDCFYMKIAHRVETIIYKREKIRFGSGRYEPFEGTGDCKKAYLTICPYEIACLFYNLAIIKGIDLESGMKQTIKICSGNKID